MNDRQLGKQQGILGSLDEQLKAPNPFEANKTMTTKTMFDQVLEKNPSVIGKWAAEDVMNMHISGTHLPHKVWCDEKGWKKYCVSNDPKENGVPYWHPHLDDNQIRVLEDKIQSDCLQWIHYDQELINLLHQDPCRVYEYARISNLPASDKLYYILLAVLGDSVLRQRLEEVLK